MRFEECLCGRSRNAGVVINTVVLAAPLVAPALSSTTRYGAHR